MRGVSQWFKYAAGREDKCPSGMEDAVGKFCSEAGLWSEMASGDEATAAVMLYANCEVSATGGGDAKVVALRWFLIYNNGTSIVDEELGARG